MEGREGERDDGGSGNDSERRSNDRDCRVTIASALGGSFMDWLAGEVYVHSLPCIGLGCHHPAV